MKFGIVSYIKFTHVQPIPSRLSCLLCNVLFACWPKAQHSLAFPASLHQRPLRPVIASQSADFKGLSFRVRSWRPCRRSTAGRQRAFRRAVELRNGA